MKEEFQLLIIYYFNYLNAKERKTFEIQSQYAIHYMLKNSVLKIKFIFIVQTNEEKRKETSFQSILNRNRKSSTHNAI